MNENESGDNLLFTGLAAGDRVDLNVKQQGCFHYREVRLSVHGGSPAWVEIVEGTAELVRHSGSVKLSGHELGRLDGLLARYRAGEIGLGCTTVERVWLWWCRGDEVVAEERFIGSLACEYDSDEVLLFTTLASWICPGANRSECRQLAHEAVERIERVEAGRGKAPGMGARKASILD